MEFLGTPLPNWKISALSFGHQNRDYNGDDNVTVTIGADSHDDKAYLYHNRVHSGIKFICNHVVLLVDLQNVDGFFILIT